MEIISPPPQERSTAPQAAAASAPSSTVNLFERAKALYNAKQYQASEGAFTQLLQSGQNQSEACYYLGVIRLNNSNWPAAREFFEKSVGFDPQNANAHFFLGELARQDGDEKKARSCYGQALEINPKHSGAFNRITEHPGIYNVMQRDSTPVSQQAVQLIKILKERIHGVKPRGSSYLGRFLTRIVACTIASFVVIALVKAGNGAVAQVANIPGGISAFSKFSLTPLVLLALLAILQPPKLTSYLALQPYELNFLRFSAVVCLIVITLQIIIEGNDILHATAVVAVLLSVSYLVCYWLWMSRLRYSFNEGRLVILRGIFNDEYQNIELYRVLDIRLQRSFFNRFTRDGSIVLFVEGVNGNHEPTPVELTGIAEFDQLKQIFQELRDVVFLLRSGNWGKGVIY